MRHIVPLACLLLVCRPTFAQGVPVSAEANQAQRVSKPERVQEVEVNGTSNKAEAERDFVAGRLVISRQQIAESRLQNVGELLKREPTVSVGKDGRIGLLGLAGYTQIIFNGEQAPGKGLLEIDLSEVERIEIIKTSTAQTGPFGIAGTINIIGRKIERQSSQQLSAGLQVSAAQYGTNAAWSINQASPSEPASWSLNVNASRKPSRSKQKLRQVSASLQGLDHTDFMGTSLHGQATETASISSNFSYRFNAHDQLIFSPSLGIVKMPNRSHEQRLYDAGAIWNIAQAAERELQNSGGRVFWKHVLQDESQLRLSFTTNRSVIKSLMRSVTSIDEFQADVQSLDQRDDSRFYGLNLEYERSFDGGHELSAGFRWNQLDLRSQYASLRNGQLDPSLDLFGRENHAREKSIRLYVQDDWRVNRQWAINTGVSTEQRQYHIVEAADSTASPFQTSEFRVWSPSFHIVRKFQGSLKRQLRFSVARNFKAPDTNDLMQRPTIHYLAPCDSYVSCTKNSLDTPDRIGNPHLQAERAWAWNASYEFGLNTDSQLTFELFRRDIDNKIGEEMSLENVAWSAQERYVLRPANLGRAEVSGASMEWKIAMRDWFKTAPKIDFKGSLTRARSRVADLPGPYNRLDGQLPWRVKFGVMMNSADHPIRVHVDLHRLPSDWIRNNQTQLSYESGVSTLNTNLVWTPNKTTSISVDLNNLLAKKRSAIKELKLNDRYLRRISERTNPRQIAVRLETSL